MLRMVASRVTWPSTRRILQRVMVLTTVNQLLLLMVKHSLLVLVLVLALQLLRHRRLLTAMARLHRLPPLPRLVATARYVPHI
jgi:hypothetical protein